MPNSQCPDYKVPIILISNLTFSTHPPRSQLTLSLQPQAVAPFAPSLSSPWSLTSEQRSSLSSAPLSNSLWPLVTKSMSHSCT